MRKVDVKDIKEAVYEMFLSSCVHPDYNLTNKLSDAILHESSSTAKSILIQLQDNINIATSNNVPMCQDTGMAVVFLDIGQEVVLEGEYLHDAINQAVRDAYKDGLFRMSVLDPITRINTNDNTPAVIHTSVIPGYKVIINVAPKGFGSENMSKIKMLTPSQGVEGIYKFVLDTVISAGGNPCPPITLGIGIGGTFEQCAINAKRALLRPLGEASDNKTLSDMEKQLLEKINNLDIGPMGMGGKTTALAVHIISTPTHIAGLPCAVNIQCHSVRHERRVI